MDWATIHWRSSILEKETTMQVLLPTTGKPPYASLYLLHSLKDDSYAWLRRTRLERLVESWPLVIVMPDGYRGFFTDNEEGPAYCRHIGEELVSYVNRTLPVRDDRDGRAIGGASMGGYGALQVGLTYAEKFCSVHSSAGAIDLEADFSTQATGSSEVLKNRSPAFFAEMRRIFGQRVAGTRHDVLELAKRGATRRTLPSIWVDCGLSDPLISGTRVLHKRLEAEQIPHQYHEFPGAHGWDYCDSLLPDALGFHACNLGLTLTAV